MWGINYKDGSKEKGGAIFEIKLRYGDGDTYQSVKEDLKNQLRAAIQRRS